MIIPPNMITHIGKIWGGEYRIPLELESTPEKPVTVLDIGANIGGFAMWVLHHSNYRVICYEPNKKNFELLERNVDIRTYDPRDISKVAIFDDSRKENDMRLCELHNVAVSDEEGEARLYHGLHNWGEHSLYKGEEQGDTYDTVKTIHAKDLPKAQIIKIDTEGSEVKIIKNIKYQPIVYAIEYHSEENRNVIYEYLKNQYRLCYSDSDRPNYGILIYVDKEYV